MNDGDGECTTLSVAADADMDRAGGGLVVVDRFDQ